MIPVGFIPSVVEGNDVFLLFIEGMLFIDVKLMKFCVLYNF